MNRHRDNVDARLERELVAARYTASGMMRPMLVYMIDMAIEELQQHGEGSIDNQNSLKRVLDGAGHD